MKAINLKLILNSKQVKAYIQLCMNLAQVVNLL